jgi:hypothetical protein
MKKSHFRSMLWPASALLLTSAVLFRAWRFGDQYRQEVISGLNRSRQLPEPLLGESDIQSLPAAVSRYLRVSGAVGRPKVNSFKVSFSGRLRKDAKSPWMPLESEQYNFMDRPTRLFFLRATMKGLPVAGFHCYKDGKAFMDIRLLSLIKVQYADGAEMDTAETVTFFNDMCCLAPATLIDRRIKWLEADGNRVRASFTANNITISAWLHFNEDGMLAYFVSDDRYAAGDHNKMEKIPWSTPMKDFRSVNGRMQAGYADAIYHYPDGDLCYGQFRISQVEYNPQDLP